MQLIFHEKKPTYILVRRNIMLSELGSSLAIATVLSGTFVLLGSVLSSSWSHYSKVRKAMISTEASPTELFKSSIVRSILLDPWSSVKKRAKAWSFLFRGPQVIQEGYNKVSRGCRHNHQC